MDLGGDEMRCVDLLEATTPSVGREVKAWETLEKTCGVIHDGGDDDDDDDDDGDDCDDSDDDGNIKIDYAASVTLSTEITVFCAFMRNCEEKNNSVAKYLK